MLLYWWEGDVATNLFLRTRLLLLLCGGSMRGPSLVM
jgi:hypothetical protein